MNNNEVFEKNMESLKLAYPVYYTFFNEYKNDGAAHCAVKNYSGKKVLHAYYHGMSYQLTSKYDDEFFCEAILPDEKDWALNGKLFLFGFSTGMYCRTFLDKVSKDHSIVVYEPSEELFYTVLQNYDISNIISEKRVILYINNAGNTMSYTSYLEKFLDYTDVYSFKCTYCHNYENIFRDESDDWIHVVFDAISNINSNYYLYESWGKEFIDNNFSNYAYFVKSKSLELLENRLPSDVPAILVSAGPSLSKNIKKLSKAKDYSIIVAVDAAVNPLMKNGIVPDVIVGVDPIKGANYISELGNESVPLICILNTARTLLTDYKGNLFFTNCHNHYSNVYLKKEGIFMPSLATGGSVANNAFSFATYLGAKTIILVGQDLAYTGDKTHAEGSVRGNEGKDFIDTKVKYQYMDIDVFGNPIRTCESFRRFKNWFEDEIEYDKTLTVIDATEGGIKINGTRIMALDDAICEYCTKQYNPQTLFEEADDLFTDSQKLEFINLLLNLGVSVENNRLRIKKCMSLYADMRKLVLEGKTNTEEMKVLSGRANEMLTNIQDDKAMSYVRDIKSTEIDEILETVYYTEDDVDKEILSICDVGEKYLTYLSEGIDEFEEITEKYWDIIRKTRDELVVKTGE